MNHINGKSLVVTGISKGIGRAITEQALEHGMTVVGWGRTAPEYEHGNLHFVHCDVTQASEIEAAKEKTLDLVGTVDMLVNNAGWGHFNKIEDFDPEKFRGMWEVNVWGAFLVTKALVSGMQEQEFGHIVNISSIAGRTGAPQGAGYNSSKFGITGLGESLFNELRKQGIKVTNIYPGSTSTEFFDEIAGMETHDNMLSPQEVAASVIHVMNTSPNFLIRELEMRPLISKKK